MITLALDTSGPVGSVAVLRADANGTEVLERESIGDGMRRGVDLFPAMKRCLARADVQPRTVEVVAVGTGPGSYTGLRVGITAARAFAYVAGAAILGVPSCDAWAAAARNGGGRLAVVLDARVNAVYVALYEPAGDAGDASPDGAAWRRTAGPELVEPGAVGTHVPADAAVVGDAFDAYPEALGGYRRIESSDHVEAAYVARLALARRARGERDAIDDVVPLYLRRATRRDAEDRAHG